ncbi:hypothetical protein IW150_000231 [Coemansia sp. RSA 2607]|nr:hypothetical protein IW150_000231 [Coemansia sp. RSA 2607]
MVVHQPLLLEEALSRCTTNLMLIADANASRYVRRMEVFVRKEAGFLVLITLMHALFVERGLVLANAHTLHVDSIARIEEEIAGLDARLFTVREHIGMITKGLVVGMPGMARLVLSVAYDPVIDRAFVGPLAHSYAGSLTSLDLRSSVVAGSAVVFDRLQSLKMVLDASGRSPVVVKSEGLRELELSRIPSTFGWHKLIGMDSCQRLRFSQLTTLTLHFMPYTTADGHAETGSNLMSVELPLLKRLEVSNASSNHALLAECAFPRHLQTVNNRYSTEALGRLQNVETIDYMRVMISNGELSTQVHAVLNRWFGGTGVCLDGGMQVFSTQHIDASVVDWQRLTFLYLAECVSFGDLARLMPRIPQVRDLALRKPEFSASDVKVLEDAGPLSVALQRLALYGAGERAACIEWLVERLPRLRSLRSTVYSADEFARFCDARQTAYPHLAGISFEAV